ncbi:hypothetical protein EV426DRAFT_423823 [Tirmania nivea]|nr:hypothetical protein EV426DRAFT_423823 [Tirmania nivea]
MHERNIYRNGVDFSQLGKDCSQFAKYLVKGPSQIDFQDPDAVRELTTSLLKRDFNLIVDLPNDRLCPPVPNRLNYIHWLQDLLDATSGGESDDYDPEREVVGLDIGVGASCIYPLLGCATRPNWKFVGTDIDPLSLHHAQRQLTLNSLNPRIHLIPTHATTPFFSPPLAAASRLDFTMCNPPFYHSPTAATSSSSLSSRHSSTQHLSHLTHLPTPITKLRPPNSPPPQATQAEMSTPGGELSFVLRILHESALPDVRTRVQWFSVMLGVKSHVVPLVEEIKKVAGGEGANFAVTTFTQGRRGGRGGTRRWGVAWSWTGWRPGWGSGVCGVKGKKIGGKVKPFKSVSKILVPVEKEGDKGEEVRVKMSILGIIEDLAKSAGNKEIKWNIIGGKNNETLLNGWVSGDIWSRAARRRRARAVAVQQDKEQPHQIQEQDRDADENSLKGMWFRIMIGPAPTTTTHNEEDEEEIEDQDEDEEMIPAPEPQLYDYTPQPQTQPHVRASPAQAHQRGSGTATQITLRLIRCKPSDTVIFESFCGMLRRKILLEPASRG